jgi:hypothetical protein
MIGGPVENHAPRATSMHLTQRRLIWNPGGHEEAEVIICVPVFHGFQIKLISSYNLS